MVSFGLLLRVALVRTDVSVTVSQKHFRGEILSFTLFIYRWVWSETKSTITAAVCWPIVLALDDKW
jgi:hypothetical protein